MVYGTGAQTRDFIYVGDVVGAIVAALHAEAPLGAEAGDGAAYNISTGAETSVNDAARRRCAQTSELPGRRRRRSPARDGDVDRSSLSTRARPSSVFGWSAHQTLDNGARHDVAVVRRPLVSETSRHRRRAVAADELRALHEARARAELAAADALAPGSDACRSRGALLGRGRGGQGAARPRRGERAAPRCPAPTATRAPRRSRRSATPRTPSSSRSRARSPGIDRERASRPAAAADRGGRSRA